MFPLIIAQVFKLVCCNNLLASSSGTGPGAPFRSEKLCRLALPTIYIPATLLAQAPGHSVYELFYLVSYGDITLVQLSSRLAELRRPFYSIMW